MLPFVGFGLLNNLLYVVILSAAVDLVGPNTPKGLVLLADVLPSLLFKVTAPFYFHICPYNYRIALVVGLSFFGMLMVSLSTDLVWKLLGIVLASFSSGIGEVSFLQLTHSYGEMSLHGWSMGTGAAGLVGSFVYMALTSYMDLSAKSALLLFSVMPFVIVYLYKNLPVVVDAEIGVDDDTPIAVNNLSALAKIKRLVVPYILPLMTVYFCEYTINQGISPTLLFDLLDMPMFRFYRDAYVMYSTLYQVGVFVSRSSGLLFRIRNLWMLAFLQCANVFLAIMQSMFLINKSIYLNFAFILFEGLLGGAAYVNTFMKVSEVEEEREFALGAVSMSDSMGIVLAALVSIWLEPTLCNYQVDHDRPWCTF